MDHFIFAFFLRRATFPLRVVQSQLMYPLSYDIDIFFIPLSHPHYIHHTQYIQKVDKPMIYVMIGREADIRELL